MTSADRLPTVMDVVRAGRSTRPPRDVDTADQLRAALRRHVPQGELTLRARDLRSDTLSLSHSSLGLLRGTLVTQLLRLASVGYVPQDPFTEAVEAFIAGDDRDEFVQILRDLDRDERDRLAADVASHAVVLRRRLGTIPPSWFPRTLVRGSVRVAGGHVVLKDTIDLVLGRRVGDTAAVALIDVTTSPLDASAERAGRFHALVHTLRTGVAPLCVATLSTATGDVVRLDVDGDTLTRAVHDVNATIHGAVAA